MKKWILSLIVLLALSIAAIYILIPKTISISKITSFRSNQEAAFRDMLVQENWSKWWPGERKKIDSPNGKSQYLYSYKGFQYRIVANKFFGFEVEIDKRSITFPSSIHIISFNLDSIGVEWHTTLQSGNNPFRRLQQYMTAESMAGNMSEILSHLKTYLQKKENLYGIHVDQEIVSDTLLITTKKFFATTPTTEEIYRGVDELQNYAAKYGATPNNPPMVNIKTGSDSQVEMMVALPLNKVVPSASNYDFKRMPPGLILVAEVKGGKATVQDAFKKMTQYVIDYKRSSAALPFESLVTDRKAQPDSSQWLTRIYFPVL